MRFIGIGLAVAALVLIIFTARRIIKEPRRSEHGLWVVASLAVVWIAAVAIAVAFYPYREASLLLAYGPIVLAAVLILFASVLLLINGVIIVVKEGLRLATLVPTVFGIFLIVTFYATFALVFYIDRLNTLVLAVIFIFVTVPLGMVLVQLAGFTLYALVYSRISSLQDADIVVVHGAGLRGEELTPLLRSRVDKGIDVFHEMRDNGYTPLLVLSGGQGADEVISEAEAMARYALNQGLSENDILREDRSTTTEENVRYALELLDERGMNDHKAVFVTSNYHVMRTASLTKRLGADAIVMGSRTALYYVPAGFLREFVATLKHFAKQNLVAWASIATIIALTFGAMTYLSSQQEYLIDENGDPIRNTVPLVED